MEEAGVIHFYDDVCSRGHRKTNLASAFATLQFSMTHEYRLKYLFKNTAVQVPAPDCCTPANLYPGSNIEKVANSLESISCGYNKAKDFALVDVLTNTGLRAWYLQPNLVRHIGAYSSIRAGVNVAP